MFFNEATFITTILIFIYLTSLAALTFIHIVTLIDQGY